MDGYQSNAQSALIACANIEQSLFEELTKTFEFAGFRFEPIKDADHADIGFIDLRFNHLSPRKLKSLAAQFRQRSPEISLILVAGTRASANERAAWRRFGEVIIAHDGLEHVIIRCRQTLRLRNFAEETGERLKSLSTLGRLVDFPPIQTSDQPSRVLIAGLPSPTAIAAMNVARSAADHCHCSLSAGQTLRALENGSFDCIIFLPMTPTDPMRSALRSIQRHPIHASIVNIQIADDLDHLRTIAQKGAREFLLSEHISTDLKPRLKLAIRRSRLLGSMRAFLMACNGDGVRDKTSGAFSPSFLSQHGARLCARADQTQRALSLIHIDLRPTTGNEPPARPALHSAARLINRLTRAEDVTARIAASQFVVLAPATGVDQASAVANRITGIIASTAFRRNVNNEPETLTAVTSVISREPGESIEEMTAAAMRLTRGATSAKQPLRRSPQ